MGEARDLEAQVRRLERRVERERRSREEAERIAEAGLQSLYEANRELDERILARTDELHRALKLAESASNAKSAFLGQMSHQINTPLNGLLGMLELLGHELSDPQVVEWHASATRSAQRLERLTTRLITYVELEDVDLRERGTPVQLHSVLADVHARWQRHCLRSGQLLSVELEPGSDILVSGTEELTVLFDELLSNALEHSGPGAVTIACRVVPSKDAAIVEVSDSGHGVDPALVDRLQSLDAAPNQTQIGDEKINLGFALIDRITKGLRGEWGLLEDGRPGVMVRLPRVSL